MPEGGGNSELRERERAYFNTLWKLLEYSVKKIVIFPGSLEHPDQVLLGI